MSTLPDSALKYLLKALIPYSEANLKLSFSPGSFFADLEKIDAKKRYSRGHWQNTYYKAKKAGLIDTNGTTPYLTSRGKAVLDLYKPKHFANNAQLMVIFDIPETQASKRRSLRRTLQKLSFTQVQRSVWISSYDSRDYLASELAWLGIDEYVQIYEVSKLT